ncbi:DUF1542 domain-containing protein [Corynebacterium hansenii]|uniref:DUF1542 domain-containing protein n=1 Tax=Corynebacterium hansenii TaxID=394964 RepID=A0ABV7ZJT2_9CORY|nr:DUF1542 domain-containing protein [Corynebacterium hansenii]WJY99350.1 hypothetical protein CHAN_03625 [Corynebacterium hansenii]
MSAILLIGIAIIGGVLLIQMTQKRQNKAIAQREHDDVADAVADARRWIERLGSQVLSISGTDTASTQAMADASERYNAASSQISTANTVKQAQLARESALEGLHYVAAAREIMGMPAGPELPPLEGQRSAGSVTEQRTIKHEGREITASPVATEETPNYYPGGRVAGRPVPAGWYSEPWWQSALRTGMWAMGSVALFSLMFNGMSGVAYAASNFESGAGDGSDGPADTFIDEGDAGDLGDGGGDDGGGFFDGLFGGDGDGGDGGGFFDGGGDGFDFDF